MRDIVHSYVRKFREERRERRKFLGVLLLLALAVGGGIMWQFKTTGIAYTNEAQCGIEEHTHSDECYAYVLTGVTGSEETVVAQETQDAEAAVVETAAAENAVGESLTKSDSEATAEAETEAEEEATDEAAAVTAAASEEALTAQVLLTEATETEDWYLSHGYEKVLICGKEEHTHTIECLNDETADLETAEVWEATLPTLTGVWADDVVAIAESQIGYVESTLNFTLAEDGATRKGYTRYGAWYGNAYGDWDAMFAAFCLHYAGVSESDFPVNSGAYAWSVSLKEAGLYQSADSCTPAAGDLAFLDKDQDGTVDTVAVITDVNDTTLTVVEGNSDDAVEENAYGISDGVVAGFGVLPEQDAESLVDAMKSYTASTEDGSVTVTVTAPYGVLPEGAELVVTLFEEESDEYAAAAEAIGYEPEETNGTTEDGIALASEDDATEETTVTSGLVVLDISFVVGDEEVEPTEAVTVNIDASALLPEEADASTIEVQHLAETDAGVEPVLVADASDDTAGTVDTETAVVEFEVESFSNFTITWSGGGSSGPNSTSYSTSVTATAYVYGSSTELSVSNISLDSGRTVLFNKNNSDLAISGYTLDSVSLTYNGKTYSNVTALTVTITTETTGTGNSQTTKTTYTYTVTYTVNGVSTTEQLYSNTSALSSTAIKVSLYYMPTVTLTAAEASSSESYDYTLTATPYGFTGTVSYTWEVSDETVATVSESGSTATFAWTESAKAGDTVTVTVTANNDSTGQTATATYVLIYKADSATFTVYYPSGTDSDGNTTYTKVGSGVTVYVYDSDGNLVTSRTTDSNGTVTLSLVEGETYNIVVGDYTVSSTTYYYSGRVTVDANGNSLYLTERVTYYHVDLRVEGGSFEITVTDSTEGQTDVTVEKIWDDNDDAACIRPTSIIVYLTDSDGNKVKDTSDNYYIAVLNASNGWTYTWEDVDLAAGTYTAVEDSVDGYTLESATEFTITGSSDSSSSSSVTYTGAITVTALSDLTVYKYGDLSSEGITVPMNTTVTQDEQTGDYEFQSASGHGENGQAPSTVLSDYVVLEENDVIAVTVTYTYSYTTDDSSEAVTGTESTTIYVTVHQSDNLCDNKNQTDDRRGYDFVISAETLLSTENIIKTTDKVTLTNTLDEDATTNLTIIKMDGSATTETYLADAQFILYYINGDTTYYYNGIDTDGNAIWVTDESYANIITSEADEDGVTVSGLTVGITYYLKEITAPDGYNLLSTIITFTLSDEANGGIDLYESDDEGDGEEEVYSLDSDDDGNLIVIVYNYPGYELPSTGGTGTYLYTLAGLLLILSAVCLMYKNLKRKGDLPY